MDLRNKILLLLFVVGVIEGRRSPSSLKLQTGGPFFEVSRQRIKGFSFRLASYNFDPHVFIRDLKILKREVAQVKVATATTGSSSLWESDTRDYVHRDPGLSAESRFSKG